MCGRFIQHSDPEVYAERFDLELEPVRARSEPRPRYNVAPSQTVLAIRADADGRRHLVALRWGLIPFWSKGPDHRYSMINARAETVDSKPAYRAAFRERRCLIPAEGFYEWRAEPSGKQPYLIRRSDRMPFGMAGIWETWKEPETGNVIASCAILVTDANPAIAPLHDRMPVVLDPQRYTQWLNPANRDSAALLSLLTPSPPSDWTLEPVSRRVNDARHDDPGLIEPQRDLLGGIPHAPTPDYRAD
jgi:putative SOS response-associated peptidase YedK